MLQHRHGWSGRLPFDIVAIPTSKVVGGRGRHFGPLFNSAADLRRRFHVGPNAQVLLVSVSSDPFLERYWRWAKEARTPGRLAELGIAGITIPNFSFFSDAPRLHHLYNRARLEACLNELAEAAVPVVPHIHALTSGDLAYWRAWLREHAEIRHVCREFQTGNDEAAIDELARLQDEIHHNLHPIIVGGARFAERLRGHFARYTIVDSAPFMKAIRRHRAVERNQGLAWESNPTTTPREVGDLIEHNIAAYGRRLGGSSAHQMSMLEVFEGILLAREAARAGEQTTLPLDERRLVRLPLRSEFESSERGPQGRGA